MQYGVLAHLPAAPDRRRQPWQTLADHDCDNGGFYGLVYDPETGTDARMAEMLLPN